MDEWEEGRNSQPLSALQLAMLTLTNFNRGPAQKISQCLASPPQSILLMFVDHEIGRACVRACGKENETALNQAETKNAVK